MATLPPDPPAFEPASAPPEPSMRTPNPRNPMIERLRRLLLTPRLEWPAIDAEPMTVAGIFKSWAVPLAAIGPVAMLIGSLVFGYGTAFFHFRPSLGFALSFAIVSYMLSLVSVWGLAKIIELLAPTFEARPDPVQAMKVAVFASTASWVAGLFQLFPPIAILGLLGVYSFYLLWLGLPMLMKGPAARATAYFASVVVAAIVLYLLVGTMATRLVSPMATITPAIGGMEIGGVDTGKLDEANKRLAVAAASIEQSARQGTPGPLVAADALQALIPDAIGGFKRTGIESSSGGIGGLGGSVAKGTYESGTDRITLSVADIGAMGALASLGGALNVNSEKHEGDSYEKTTTNADGITSEKWNSAAREGSYQRMIARRFMVEVHGNAADLGVLKTAAGAIDAGRLAALAKG